MNSLRIGILHYSAPTVVGGVESVISAHSKLLVKAGYSTVVIAGEGDTGGLPGGVQFIQIPELSTRHPNVLRINQELEQGRVPGDFERLVSEIKTQLESVLESIDRIIIHNVFTKHFNLPLTAALARLLEEEKLKNCIAWCHDFSWTSVHSKNKVFSGYPWDLLRTPLSGVVYVTVSNARQKELAELFGIDLEQIEVIYNGVDP